MSTQTSRISTLDEWFDAFLRPSTLTELAVLLACILLAWLVTHLAGKTRREPDKKSVLFGRSTVDGVLFPFLLLLLAFACKAVLTGLFPLVIFKLAIPVLLSLALIRLGVKVLQLAFKDAPLIKALERTISWLAWIAVVLWVSGLLPVILDELDGIKWKVGGSMLSVRTLLEGAVTDRKSVV